MQRLVFTVAIGCASRALLLRDRLLGWPKKTAAEAETGSLLVPHRIPSGDNLLDAVFDTRYRADLSRHW